MLSKLVSVHSTHTAAVAETLETYVDGAFRTRIYDTRQVHRISPVLYVGQQRERVLGEGAPWNHEDKPGLGQGRVEQAHRDLHSGVSLDLDKMSTRGY